MNNFDNKDRNRYYGLRIGDVVKSSQYNLLPYGLAVVVAYGFMDNNKVKIKTLGDGNNIFDAVAEWLEVVLPKEDKKLESGKGTAEIAVQDIKEDKASEWTTEANIIVDFLKFKEYAIEHGGDGNDYEFLEAFTQTYKPKLITEQFLLSKGYEKKRNNKFCLKRQSPKEDVWIEFNQSSLGGIIITYDDNPYDFTWYNGKTPTESQYEVLNQLLELHL
jgi:hypothetical protein